ncbi:MAG: hypothetical protein GYB36_02990 [Alphaproteobacteria bacterium]|nr:hypothetical protein [Alphaproteobacteria bacterium]
MTGFNAEAIKQQLPNTLTILRMVLSLAGAVGLWLSYSWSLSWQTPPWLSDPTAFVRGLAVFAVIAFIVAAATDWLDGFLARRWSAETALGRFLDPVADKLLINGYLLVYALILDTPLIILVPVAAMILRDVVITLIRWSSPRGIGEAVRVSLTAKLKTAFAISVAGLPLLAALLGWQNNDLALNIWISALWIAAALTLLTGLEYWRRPAS